MYVVTTAPQFSFANEMPLAGISANGLTIKDDNNIQIEKEELYISYDKIEVSYVFRNNSDKDIVTQVAFPIPLHHYDSSGHVKQYPVLSDFKVEVNGQEQKYSERTRALVGKTDYTSLLTSLKISIRDFGNKNLFYGKLSEADQKKLLDLGLVSDDPASGEMPEWAVETIYYWTQSFPANNATKIKHTYAPIPSFNMYYLSPGMANPLSGKPISMKQLADSLCVSYEELMGWIKKWDAGRLTVNTIDYILTTANHWKKPIKEFHLVVDGSKGGVSTCFEKNKLKKINDSSAEMTIKDFIPTEEIKVFFF
jgi:hypothetical protein